MVVSAFFERDTTMLFVELSGMYIRAQNPQARGIYPGSNKVFCNAMEDC